MRIRFWQSVEPLDKGKKVQVSPVKKIQKIIEIKAGKKAQKNPLNKLLLK